MVESHVIAFSLKLFPIQRIHDTSAMRNITNSKHENIKIFFVCWFFQKKKNLKKNFPFHSHLLFSLPSSQLFFVHRRCPCYGHLATTSHSAQHRLHRQHNQQQTIITMITI